MPANLTTPPCLYDIDHDVRTDFAPVVPVAGASTVQNVTNDPGIGTAAEFIAPAEAHPGEVTFATAGAGRAANLAAELVQTETGVDMTVSAEQGVDG